VANSIFSRLYLFISGPVLSIVSYLQIFLAANIAARNILDLECRLPEPRIPMVSANPACFEIFRKIQFKDCIFGHPGQDGA
jgi:ABC-type siderophore export system fused ATPase/permease subunit